MTAGSRAPAHNRTTSQDVQATLKTLNQALGGLGGKQKSWMTDSHSTSGQIVGAAPVVKRKPGRPPKYRAIPRPQSPHQTITGPVRPTVESGRETHPPSNSTSPQLANQGFPLTALNTVLPSPAPSEEDIAVNSAAIRNNDDLFSSNNNIETAAVHDEGGLPKDTSPEAAFMEGLRQAARPSKRLSETDEAQAEKRNRIGTTAQQNMLPTSNVRLADERGTSLGQAQVRSPSISHVLTRSPSLGSQSYNHPSPRQVYQGMQIHPQAQAGVGGTPPQVQAPFGPPRALSRGIAQQPYGVPSGNHSTSPLPHSPVVSSPLIPSDYFTKQYCIQEMNSFHSRYRPSQDHPRDGIRLNVLRDAIEKEDWAYLTMHQYYCLLTTDPQSLPLNLRRHPNLHYALRAMRDALDSNNTLSLVVTHFFMTFPMPIAQIAMTWPRRYEHEQQMFLRFIMLSSNFDVLRDNCEKRNFPPLVGELFYDLGIASSVFQQILFTSVLRRIWRNMPHSQPMVQFEEQAVSIFRDNQNEFRQREANRSNHQTYDFDSIRQEKAFELQTFGRLLNQLCEGREKLLVNSSLYPPSQAQAPQQLQRQTRQQPQNNPTQISAPAPAMQYRPIQTTRTQPLTAQAAIARGRGRPPGRPPIYGSVPSQRMVPSQPVPRTEPVQQTQPLLRPKTSLLPPRGWHQPLQRQPNPGRFGLHQAHLRSPVLQAQSATSMLYQYVKGFFKHPVRLTDAGQRIERWTFSMSSKELQSIPTDVARISGEPATRIVNENSRMLRLRCVKWLPAKLPDDQAWAIAETSWLPYTYFTFNGSYLHPRKKLYYGKDLPIDISALVQEGNNTLEIAVMRQASDETYLNYLLAIEIVGFKSHDTIKQECCTSRHISAAQTMSEIKNKLSGTSDDDEIAIVQSYLTISLFDPFSASRICDIPARGKACLHFDCFDLETYLQTRRKNGHASVADQWKCPICNVDARPDSLIVDGFFEDVRKKLEEQGLIHTRAIIVNQDGSWKPRMEPGDNNSARDRGSPDNDDYDDDDDDDDNDGRPATSAVESTTGHVEVIDLSD